MKRTILLLTFICAVALTFAAPINTVVSNGNWGNPAIWSLNRLPVVGDTIQIPANKTVIVNADYTINGFSYVRIWGKLRFQLNNSTLKLGATSLVWVYTGGTVEGEGSPSQKLRIGNSTVFDGNDAPILGPQMANTTGFSPVPLPVKFIGFNLSQKNKDVLIQWSTAEEYNANLYEVERSLNGSDWVVIAYVTAAGNSTSIINYSFTDKNLTSKTAYYRIKQVDLDGKFAYTPVRAIKATNEVSPVKIGAVEGKKVLLHFQQEVKGAVLVRFISTSGQVVAQQTVNNPIGQIILNADALKGSYVVAVDGTDVTAAKQVVL